MNSKNQVPSKSKIQVLKNRIEEIRALINEQIFSDTLDISPLTDGIVDVEKYINSKYKILWILKEPYADVDEFGKPEGGGWDLPEMINSNKTIYDFGRSRKTFKPMIYTSWGIFNDFRLFDDMDDVENDPSMIDALKSIAYINVKKLPGLTSSYEPEIKAAYHRDRIILLKQIEAFNPDIIIGGSTLHHFLDDLDIKADAMQWQGNLKYIIKDRKIFITTYHPAQRPNTTGYSVEEYCNDIIEAVKAWSITLV